MLAAAMARRTRPEAGVILSDTLETLVPATVTLGELTDACTRPARTYLRDRLDVRLPRTRENMDPNIPLVVAPLDIHSLGEDLLRRHHEEPDNAGAVWRETTRLQGGLPPRALANAALGSVEEEVATILAALPDLRDLFCSATQSIDVDLSLCPAPWTGRVEPVALRETVDSLADNTVVRVQFTRPKARTRIAAALALAAVIATRPDEPWSAVVAMRGAGTGVKPVVLRLLPLEQADRRAAAEHFLGVALDLRLRALREPLPLFEVSRDLFECGTVEDRDLDRDMWDDANAFLWGGMSVDDLLAIAPVHSDPVTLAVPSGAALPSRMLGYAQTVWQAYRDFVLECDGAP